MNSKKTDLFEKLFDDLEVQRVSREDIEEYGQLKHKHHSLSNVKHEIFSTNINIANTSANKPNGFYKNLNSNNLSLQFLIFCVLMVFGTSDKNSASIFNENAKMFLQKVETQLNVRKRHNMHLYVDDYYFYSTKTEAFQIWNVSKYFCQFTPAFIFFVTSWFISVLTLQLSN